MRYVSTVRVRPVKIKISMHKVILFVLVLYAVLAAYVLVVFGGSLQIVDFTKVYDQRQIGDELAAGTFVGYAMGHLAGSLNPLLIALGLARGRTLWVGLGAIGQLLVYAATAAKGVLLSIFLLPIFYFALIRSNELRSDRLGLLAMVSCLAPLPLLGLLPDDPESWEWTLAALIYMRTYGVAGTLPGIYAEFFSKNPLTYYSHINIISLFVEKPYEDVGEQIGASVFGSDGMQANAGFWATDGIAAMGVAGIIIIGLFVGAFLSLVDSYLSARMRRIACFAGIPFILVICNASFLTALLTHGGILLFVLLYLVQEAEVTGQRSMCDKTLRPPNS
jgi:hypothetical protein